MAAPKLPGDLSWPKLLGTSLAAVTAAWVAGHIGFANALTGAAIGSMIATTAAAFFTSTIDRGHSVLIRTERGTVIEAHDAEGVADDTSGTATLPTQPAAGSSRWSRINWPAVTIAAIVTLAITLVAMTLYEEAVGRTWGANKPGTTIGNTLNGAPPPTPTPTPSPTPTPTPTKSPSPSPSPSDSTSPSPSPQPSASESVTPSPSPSPSPSDSATASPEAPALQ
jgi:hypothetical protein